jgi:hypothetical protein
VGAAKRFQEIAPPLSRDGVGRYKDLKMKSSSEGFFENPSNAKSGEIRRQRRKVPGEDGRFSSGQNRMKRAVTSADVKARF